MKEFVELKQIERECYTVFKKLSQEFNWWSIDRYEVFAVEAIKEAMNDNDNWIEFWLYELDCGKKKSMVKNKHGKAVPINTLNQLYEAITNKKLWD